MDNKDEGCMVLAYERTGNARRGGSSTTRYTNCMEAFWKPSCEGHEWVVKDAVELL